MPLFSDLNMPQKHGASVGPVPPNPPVADYGVVKMTETVTIWDALEVLAPAPIQSPTVKTMEELDQVRSIKYSNLYRRCMLFQFLPVFLQGYGYIMYSARLPNETGADADGLANVALGGMRDRALIFLDEHLHQICGRGALPDDDSCTPPTQSGPNKVGTRYDFVLLLR